MYYPELVQYVVIDDEQREGIRVKLLAADGNYIDGMFLDRRNKSQGSSHFGNKLVTMLLTIKASA